MIGKWRTVRSTIKGDFKIFSLKEIVSQSPRTGNNFPFYVIEAGDWINIIPITSDGRVLLVRQYRHGSADITLEIPGGMVDKDDSNPVQSAERELLEETGYAAGQLIKLGSVNPNPAIFNNKLHIFLAADIKKAGEQRLEGTEDIEITFVEYRQIAELIASGSIDHALVICAFYLLERYEHRRLFSQK